MRMDLSHWSIPFRFRTRRVNSWYEVYVDAYSGEILSVTDFVAEATVSFLFIRVLSLH